MGGYDSDDVPEKPSNKKGKKNKQSNFVVDMNTVKGNDGKMKLEITGLELIKGNGR